MHHKSRGIQFHDPEEKHSINHVMTGFVDDTTHWINNFKDSLHGRYNQSTMYSETNKTAQWWEQLLNASGGKLELTKCFYYNISWQFNTEGEPELMTPKSDHRVTIKSSENDTQFTIEEKSSFASHKTLGVMENPSGNYMDEYKNIQQKSQLWHRRIINQNLNRQELKLFYQSFYLPSIRYHLIIGTFTHTQLDTIQHPILQTILSRMGYNSNMPKAVIYGPTSAGGLGFQHLMVIQGVQKIKHILQAYRHHTPLIGIIHTTLQWAQHIAGIKESIFVDTTTPIPSLQKEL